MKWYSETILLPGLPSVILYNPNFCTEKTEPWYATQYVTRCLFSSAWSNKVHSSNINIGVC